MHHLARLGSGCPADRRRTGAVVSGALDGNTQLNDDFLQCWNKLIDDGLC